MAIGRGVNEGLVVRNGSVSNYLGSFAILGIINQDRGELRVHSILPQGLIAIGTKQKLPYIQRQKFGSLPSSRQSRQITPLAPLPARPDINQHDMHVSSTDS